MDRRQRKTREAIFRAFSELLSEKTFHQITIGEIIARADVGRATFYAHFETKDFLLKALCEELFDHILDTAMGLPQGQYHCTCGHATDSVFLHLLRHLQEDDRPLLQLLSSQNNEIFMRYFKDNLKKLIVLQYAEKGQFQNATLPTEYLVNHLSSSFVETVVWWIGRRCVDSPDTIAEYFLATVEPILKGGTHA